MRSVRDAGRTCGGVISGGVAGAAGLATVATAGALTGAGGAGVTSAAVAALLVVGAGVRCCADCTRGGVR